MKKLNVNQEMCISCGACIQIDEEHFDFTENGTSTVISQENLESDNVSMAIDACPVGAIGFIETDENSNSCNCGGNCHCEENGSSCNCHNE